MKTQTLSRRKAKASPERVRVFSSRTQDYHGAFDTFLKHTDQKIKAREWLDRFVGGLKERRVFVDAGAGNGKVTAWLTSSFNRTIAIEPNDSLREELFETCPEAEIHGKDILAAKVPVPADFVLASHVFYYIHGADWMKNLEQIVSWLGPGGEAVIILQNRGTDCMKMLKRFHKKSFDLRPLAEKFKKKHGKRYRTSIETVPAHVTTSDFGSAYIVAEFMLNLLPMKKAPSKKVFGDYVRQSFASGKESFRFSCHQDFLRIRKV